MDKFVKVRWWWMGAGTSVTLMRTFDKDEETGEHTSKHYERQGAYQTEQEGVDRANPDELLDGATSRCGIVFALISKRRNMSLIGTQIGKSVFPNPKLALTLNKS